MSAVLITGPRATSEDIANIGVLVSAAIALGHDPVVESWDTDMAAAMGGDGAHLWVIDPEGVHKRTAEVAAMYRAWDRERTAARHSRRGRSYRGEHYHDDDACQSYNMKGWNEYITRALANKALRESLPPPGNDTDDIPF